MHGFAQNIIHPLLPASAAFFQMINNIMGAAEKYAL